LQIGPPPLLRPPAISTDRRRAADAGDERRQVFLLSSSSVGIRGKNDEVERATIRESDSCEMTHVTCRQTPDAERLGERNNRTVHKAKTEVSVAPIDLHRPRELIQRRRYVGERAACDVPHEASHRFSLVTKEIIDFGEYESRNVTGPSRVDGMAKQPMIGRIRDQVVE
jgi:hypothetical protein